MKRIFNPVILCSSHHLCNQNIKPERLPCPSTINAEYALLSTYHAILLTLLKSSTFKISTPSLISTSQI